MEAAVRLDFYHGFGGIATPGKAHGVEMIRKKLEILEKEIPRFLPSLAKRRGYRLEPYAGLP